MTKTAKTIGKLVSLYAERAALRALKEVVALAAAVLEDTALARTPVRVRVTDEDWRRVKARVAATTADLGTVRVRRITQEPTITLDPLPTASGGPTLAECLAKFDYARVNAMGVPPAFLDGNPFIAVQLEPVSPVAPVVQSTWAVADGEVRRVW